MSTSPKNEYHPFGEIILANVELTHFRSAVVQLRAADFRVDVVTVEQSAEKIDGYCKQGLGEWLYPAMGDAGKVWALNLRTVVSACLSEIICAGRVIPNPRKDKIDQYLDELLEFDRQLQFATVRLRELQSESRKRVKKKKTTRESAKTPADSHSQKRLVSGMMPASEVIKELLLILKNRKGKGLVAKKLLSEIAKKGMTLKESTFYRHYAPVLKRHGVRNLHARGGYFIE